MRKRFLIFVLIFCVLIVVVAFSGCQAKTLAFSVESLDMTAGESIALPLTVTPAGGNYDISSYNESIARVEDGILYAVGTGEQSVATTIIEASSGSVTAYLTVNVYKNGVPSDNSDAVVVSYFLVNDDYTAYSRAGILQETKLQSGQRLTADLCRVNSTTAGYAYSGDWYYDVACTRIVTFPTIITENITLYKEPMILRDGRKHTLKSGAILQAGIDLEIRSYNDNGTTRYGVYGLSYPNLPYKDIQIPQTYVYNGATVVLSAVYQDAFGTGTSANAPLVDTLVSVSLPTTVEYIGSRAFYGLTKLESVTYAEGFHLKEVGEDILNDTAWYASAIVASEVSGVATGGVPTNYYRGVVFANCLLHLDAAKLDQYSYTVYYLPAEGGRQSITCFSSDVNVTGITVKVASVEVGAYNAVFIGSTVVAYDA